MAARRAGRVIAVDLSDKMIAQALSLHNAENIEYICGNVLDMTFEDASLDAIITTATAHHLPYDWLRLYDCGAEDIPFKDDRKKEFRNQGVGLVLLDYLIDEAKSLGYAEMSVGVDTDNARARHLFEKKGFTTVLFEGKDEYGEYVKLLKRL